MKNHVCRDGKLLQTNKKWSALKQSQREWIYDLTRMEHAAYVEKNGRLPMKKRKDEVIDFVYGRLDERGVWIPYREFRSHVAVYIDKLNHKSPLWTPPVKKAVPPKPKIPKVGVEDFPDDVRLEISGKFAASIKRYILQTHRIPPNKIRDGEIKNILRGFNSKQWHRHGQQLQNSETLLAMYDELRHGIFADLDGAGMIPCKISKADSGKLRAQGVFLETERLRLRKLTTKDYKELREMLGDAEVMAAWERVFATKREIITEWIARQLNRYEKELVGYFAAVDKQSGEMVGQIGLMWNDIQGRRCLEVGYILKKSHWGEGYATEGAKACIEKAFENFGVNKVYVSIRPENTRSIAVAERIGMKPEGGFVKKYNGKKMKHLIYSISKE